MMFSKFSKRKMEDFRLAEEVGEVGEREEGGVLSTVGRASEGTEAGPGQ